jgi:hypothetical protein
MSHYDDRESHREYDYWTDERVRQWLDSEGGVEKFYVSDGLYGKIGPGGVNAYMDDDDDRVAAVIAYLQRIGATRLPGAP